MRKIATPAEATMPLPARAASGRFTKPKGPSQGQPKGPSQGQPKGPSQGQPKGPSQGQSDASASEASRAPSAASFFRSADELSDNESIECMSDASSMMIEKESRSRKRAFLKDGSEGSDGSATEHKKKAKAKKPVTAADTHDVGLVDAERQLNLARRAQVQQDLEERVAAQEQRACVARAKAGYGASRVLYADHSLAELERMAEEDEEEIVEVASKSSNLKGTFQKSLKCRAASMRSIIGELVQRKATDETRQLQAKVDRLQSEVSQLHLKLSEATARRSQPEPRPAAEGPSSNLEEVIRKVISEERAFTRACIAGIEDRLLPEERHRPPLAADNRQSDSGPSTQGEDALLPSTTPSNQWTEVAGGKRRRRRKAKKAETAVPAVPATTPPTQSQQTTTGKGKGKGVGKESAPGSATAAPAAKAAPAGKKKNLVPPKSAAVVVTLTAEAAERGETYASVMMRARTNADPTQLGIGKVSCRRTQTGARIFEFPGADGGANADLFAQKLKEVIADAAKVARPVKLATLEVTDLDDSVTKEEVVAAVATIGGCDVAAVQGRDIRPGRGGMGTIRLECPVAVAKAVLAKGRLLVGFSSGVVRALAAQPLRCYKCFGTGHTRALCPSTVDRTDSCLRCGKDGHKRAACKAATPHCTVCAASGRPAGHVMMGRNCNPPPKRGKAQAPIRPAAATAVPEAETSAAVEEEGAMSD